MKLVPCVLLIVLIKPEILPAARILGVVPTPSYSHQVLFQPLWKNLSLRGHQVTVLTTNPINNKTLTNLTEIDLSLAYKAIEGLNGIEFGEKPIHEFLIKVFEAFDEVIRIELENKAVQSLINDKNQHFDVVLVEGLFPVMYAFAERFKSPFIVISSLDSPLVNYQAIGNPLNPVANPDVLLPYVGGHLSFAERVVSTLTSVFMKLFNDYFVIPKHDLLVKTHFGADYPSLQNIVQNVSALFVNTDNIFHTVKPLLPTVVQIGGRPHFSPPKPLPNELKERLDKATNGFIYFSLGSNVKSVDLPKRVRDIIVETFEELPYLVLWKYESNHSPTKSNNVIISKWFPQRDVFAHKNIKLLITQGGLQSVEEAIYTYVPMIGLPIFTDQGSNLKRLEHHGICLALDYKTMTKESFKSAIIEVIENKSYKEKIIEMVKLAVDQPQTGLDRALWWTEYIIRHKGTRHLKSPIKDIPWYQLLLLDVISVIVLVSMLVLLIIKAVGKLCYNMLCRSKEKVKKA